MFDMKQILVRLTPGLAQSLERIAPGRGRKRSEFIRNAIIKAIWAAEEVHTEAAYRKWPQAPMPFDPGAWAPESEAIHPTAAELREMGLAADESPPPARSRRRRAARSRRQSARPATPTASGTTAARRGRKR